MLQHGGIFGQSCLFSTVEIVPFLSEFFRLCHFGVIDNIDQILTEFVSAGTD